MNYLHAVVLGIVEGITEFLPISSTGHLILTARLLRIPDSEFVRSFEIIIQLGAMMAVLGLYVSRLNIVIRQIPKLIVAFAPTAAVGLVLYPFIKQMLGSNEVVLWSLLIGGGIIVCFELWHTRRTPRVLDLEGISHAQAFGIGVFQSLAVIPGVSRAAATIVGGMVLGVSRPAIVEFSFLLALPTIVAAAGFDLLKTPLTFSGSEWCMLAIGFTVSCIVALVVLKWFIRFISHHSFLPFGVYRIVAALGWFFIA